MKIPDWWETLILTAAAWRIFHLLAHDDILNRPRRYVTRLDPRWRKEGDPTGMTYRETLGNFITCPFCLGFWIALATWGLWELWPHGALVAATPLTFSAVVVAAQRYLSSE